jgi:hypothetical protein
MVDQLWSIILPEACTNLCDNPSFETGVTGWTTTGTNTIAKSPTRSFKGANSLQITYGNSADLATYNLTFPTVSTSYTITARVYVPSAPAWTGTNLTWTWVNLVGATITGVRTWTAASSLKDAWVEIESLLTLAADVTGGIILQAGGAPTAGHNIWLDCVQIEQKAYPTTYVDGDQPGCEWTGTAHGSRSTRSAQARQGGRVYNLGTYGLAIRYNDGVGMPQAQHQTQALANLPGAIFKGRKVLPRVLTLTSVLTGTSAANLHGKRKDLIDIIKPDLVKDDQPFILRYSGANSVNPVEIAATYDTGLGFDVRYYGADEFGLRCIAYDPYFYELQDGGTNLTYPNTIANVRNILAKVNSAWTALGPPSSAGTVNAITSDTNYIYVGGSFTNWNGDGNSDYIVRYSKAASTWSSFGVALLNGAVNCMAVGPDGSLYVGGAFTLAGAAAANYIVRWDGSAWQLMGTGMNGAVNGIAVGLDNSVYATGAFTTAGGGAAVRVAKWDGAAWSALSTGLNGTGRAAAIGPDGSLYVTGDFATAGGTTVNYVAKWNGSAWSAMDAGLSASGGYAITVGPSGRVYVGGAFAVAPAYCVVWDGNGWSALGSGPNGAVYSLDFDKNGVLYAGGVFTSAGGVTNASRLAVWNGSSWAHVDATLPGAPSVTAIHIDGDNSYFGFDTTGTAYTSYNNTVINSGTCAAYPVLHIYKTGGTSGILKWIKNETTGKTLYLNYTLRAGETLLIDLTPGNRSAVSSWGGNVIGRALLRNSDVADFHLLPGTNTVSAFAEEVGGGSLIIDMVWRNTHGSADGAAA